MTSLGLDVGTSFLCLAREEGEGVIYRVFRDAFYKLTPPTKIAAAMIERSLKGRSYFTDGDSFVLVGTEAIEKAVERHDKARRPLYRGVISPREPEARKVLKFILSQLVGKGNGETLVYSVPAEPIDQLEEDFNTGFHHDVLERDLRELGYEPKSLNEAEAICYAEGEGDGYSLVSLSCGAGMINICIMIDGEAMLRFSLSRSGDWIDRMTAQSTGQSDSTVQMEKENGVFSVGKDNDNPILSVVSAYYVRLIDYIVQNLSLRLSKRDLPNIKQPIPIVVSGGTSLADGFVSTLKDKLQSVTLPFDVKEVRHATEPLYSVAKGCLLCAEIL